MAACEMPGVIPPHDASLPANQMTPEARKRQHEFQQRLGRCEHGFKQPHTTCDQCMQADYDAGQKRLADVRGVTFAYWMGVPNHERPEEYKRKTIFSPRVEIVSIDAPKRKPSLWARMFGK